MAAPLIIAHRTCPVDAPENSLAGIRVAAEKGADGVEIDLRVSLDQRPFLMHDWTMRRMTGWPLPIELTPSPIVRARKLSVSDEPPPALSAAMDTLPESMQLAVDVKTPWAIGHLMREVKRRGWQDRVLVWCTSALDVRYAVRVAPETEVAYLKDVKDARGKHAFLQSARRLGAKAVSAHWLAIERGFVDEAHSMGLKVYSYHHGYELDAEKLTSGLDGLITDFPVEAREAIAAVVV